MCLAREPWAPAMGPTGCSLPSPAGLRPQLAFPLFGPFSDPLHSSQGTFQSTHLTGVLGVPTTWHWMKWQGRKVSGARGLCGPLVQLRRPLSSRLLVKRYVRKGVPLEHRARVWMALSGAQAQMDQNPGYYHRLLQGERNPRLEDAIRTGEAWRWGSGMGAGPGRNRFPPCLVLVSRSELCTCRFSPAAAVMSSKSTK
ncbi:hypothetical protein P7K49_000064 [Saguinus oedipus]|uniref:Rab-GAP TBC domain-containing protein n=1 Tax=Saguinus oedipus TaxID=9490 RepID=A0ABQ9WAM0_SAGOE|nr:hypothetical protein P7K49_000064 [Saguinus oedipus]